MTMRRRAITATAALTFALTLAACSTNEASDQGAALPSATPLPPSPTTSDSREPSVTSTSTARHPYVGMWVTADGHIRQELTADGRYDEARGTRKSAYTGSYTITGNQIDYVDDTGFTADGTFVDADTLHHGGMIFHRER
ncbi:protein Atu4866 [Sinosporangium album]|uniref:Protein Atu4866 n=1 Tax=Sinosporangium album TaxID=504805 RepID=A0A1G7ZMZ1_9ACTN|nr:Atu4866 domain-containing protein [Sinosporangium album]SDH09937.1 protein Atu4866 [Sinosporangium album]